MKRITTRKEFDNCREGIAGSLNCWVYINGNGCNDPSYADGCNMNLVRNHILYYKNKILEICNREGFAVPEEYYLPVPPEVDNNFMANLKQKDRVGRLRQHGNVLVTGKVSFDRTQLGLF